MVDFVDSEELEDRRGITKSNACRMPPNGSRQGMRWSAAVMSLRCEDVIQVVIPPPPARVATFAAVPIGGIGRKKFSLCVTLVAIRMRYWGEHAER